MTNEDQEKLIKLVMAEIARQSQTQKNKPVSIKVLAIFSGGHIGLDDVLERMQDLQREGYCFEVVFTPNAKMVIGKQKIQAYLGPIAVHDEPEDLNKLNQIFAENEAVIIPVMTMNTAAKIANGIADNLATTLIMMSLLSAKRVIAVRDACNLRHLIREKMGQNKASKLYNKILNSNFEQLEDLGMVLCDAHRLAETIKQSLGNSTRGSNLEIENQQIFKKRVLSIEDLPKASTTIRISPGTIITPAAKDTIKERGIEVIVH